jgi:hypothetical protein
MWEAVIRSPAIGPAKVCRESTFPCSRFGSAEDLMDVTGDAPKEFAEPGDR